MSRRHQAVRLLQMLAFLFVAVLVGWSVVGQPHDAQIRLDTADLRKRLFLIPYDYRRTPEPLRARIVALTARSVAIGPKWVTCRYRSRWTFRDWYAMAAAYVEVDPAIARMAIEDLAAWLEKTGGQEGAPVVPLTTAVLERDPVYEWRVADHWTDWGYDLVYWYLTDKGYEDPGAVLEEWAPREGERGPEADTTTSGLACPPTADGAYDAPGRVAQVFSCLPDALLLACLE